MLGHSPLSTDALSASGVGAVSVSVNVAFSSVTNTFAIAAAGGSGVSIGLPSIANPSFATAIETNNALDVSLGQIPITIGSIATASGGAYTSVSLAATPVTGFSITALGVITTAGVVVDGYLSGSTVARVNNSQTATVTTNSSGEFSGLDGTGSIKVTGGTDMATNQTFDGIFTAPDNGTYVVVTPVSTLIDALVNGGHVANVTLASSTIRNALSLPNVNLLTTNPLTGTYPGGSTSSFNTLQLFKANQMISKTLQLASGGN